MQTADLGKSDDDFLDAGVFHALAEVVAVDTVTISYHETRRFVIRRRIDNLLTCPTGSWMDGDIEVNNATPVMPEDNEAV